MHYGLGKAEMDRGLDCPRLWTERFVLSASLRFLGRCAGCGAGEVRW